MNETTFKTLLATISMYSNPVTWTDQALQNNILQLKSIQKDMKFCFLHITELGLTEYIESIDTAQPFHRKAAIEMINKIIHLYQQCLSVKKEIMSKVTAPDLLNKAAQHMADRAKTYDKPEGERSMGKTVEAFNTITGKNLSEAEGWLLMQLLKNVRLFTRPGYHADSAEDNIAYAALMAEAKAKEHV